MTPSSFTSGVFPTIGPSWGVLYNATSCSQSILQRSCTSIAIWWEFTALLSTTHVSCVTIQMASPGPGPQFCGDLLWFLIWAIHAFPQGEISSFIQCKLKYTKIGWLSWSLAVIKASIIDLLGLNRILCLNRHLSKKCSKSKQRVHEVLCYYWENYIQPSLGIWTNDLLFNARRSRNCGIPLMTGC